MSAPVFDFPIVTADGFPHGLRCDRCDRRIRVGQPYSRSPHGVTRDGETVSVLVCVYCTQSKREAK